MRNFNTAGSVRADAGLGPLGVLRRPSTPAADARADMFLGVALQPGVGRSRPAQVRARVVIKVKGGCDDAWFTAESDRVNRHRDRCRPVPSANPSELDLECGLDT